MDAQNLIVNSSSTHKTTPHSEEVVVKKVMQDPKIQKTEEQKPFGADTKATGKETKSEATSSKAPPKEEGASKSEEPIKKEPDPNVWRQFDRLLSFLALTAVLGSGYAEKNTKEATEDGNRPATLTVGCGVPLFKVELKDGNPNTDFSFKMPLAEMSKECANNFGAPKVAEWMKLKVWEKNPVSNAYKRWKSEKGSR